MKNDSEAIAKLESKMHGSLKSYLIGFILSIVLTLAAFLLVIEHMLTPWNLILTISSLAGAQALVQLFFFLHLGVDSRPPWNLIVFIFMVVIVAILIIGSLWIMYNLDYYMMGSK